MDKAGSTKGGRDGKSGRCHMLANAICNGKMEMGRKNCQYGATKVGTQKHHVEGLSLDSTTQPWYRKL